MKASTKATVGRDHVRLQWSAFRQSRQTINLLDVSKITTLLYLDLCLFTIIYLWLRLGFTSWYKFNLSNLYPIDGPAFLLTQVCLVCPWVLHNGDVIPFFICRIKYLARKLQSKAGDLYLEITWSFMEQVCHHTPDERCSPVFELLTLRWKWQGGCAHLIW